MSWQHPEIPVSMQLHFVCSLVMEMLCRAQIEPCDVFRVLGSVRTVSHAYQSTFATIKRYQYHYSHYEPLKGILEERSHPSPHYHHF